MKTFARIVALSILVLPSASFASFISGNIASGNYSGVVNSSNAWITSSALDGDAVNFWTFSGQSGDILSVVVNSTAIEFGASLYSGLAEQNELLFSGFNNSGDFADNIFIAGTNPVTGAIGTSLLNILLPANGLYTLAVGGEQGLDFGGRFVYDMDVKIVAVPEPAALLLFASGLLCLGLFHRRRSQQ